MKLIFCVTKRKALNFNYQENEEMKLCRHGILRSYVEFCNKFRGNVIRSGSFCHQAKIVKKSNLDSYCFVTSFRLFVIEKRNKQKTFFFKLVGILKVSDEKSRIRIRIRIRIH
jgi:hypothetical protein